MAKLKDIPKIDRPRERFLEKGQDALSKSELLAILLGSGIKGKNIKQLSNQIDAVSLTSEIRDKKKEYLVCLYLNARNALLKKKIISIGTLDKSLIHPREIFGPAVELRSAGIILLHNHPSGDVEPSKQDIEVINKILKAGKIMGVNVIDFVIVSEKDIHSVFQSSQQEITHYVSDGVQYSLFDLLETEQPTYTPTIKKIHKIYFYPASRVKASRFQLQNRRYLGNKHKLLGFIEDIVNEKCNGFSVFCDIFAGTGVVAERFNLN